jgi:hypothetical protein
MTASRSGAFGVDVLDQSDVLELARRTAEPAVTILMPVAQPVVAHPDTQPRLRALLERALDIVESWWGPEVAERVSSQLERLELQLDPRSEVARGLAILATPDDGRLLRLPFGPAEQAVVDRTFATRQLLEGIARHPRFRVLVLDGHHAKFYDGQGDRLVELSRHGFPLHVEPPREWDTPQRDLPIHEEAEKEQHRAVYRAVDEALEAVSRTDPLPIVVTAAERELALFGKVTRHGDLIAGQVSGNYEHADPAELAAAVLPVLEAHRVGRHARVVERLREAHGRERAVMSLDAVRAAANEGRGHLLVVEQGFTFPRHRIDEATSGVTPEKQLEVGDVVDDVIETVLLAGGDVEFVEDGALDDCGRIGLLLRY